MTELARLVAIYYRIGKAGGNPWQNRQARGKVNRPMASRGPVYASPRPQAPPISRCAAHAGAGGGELQIQRKEIQYKCILDLKYTAIQVHVSKRSRCREG